MMERLRREYLGKKEEGRTPLPQNSRGGIFFDGHRHSCLFREISFSTTRLR